MVAIISVWQSYSFLALLLISFNEPDEPVSCGQSCCYLLLTRLQQPITMADLDQDFARLNTETSFHDLQIVLESRGVPVTPWKLEWADIQAIRGPFIVHIDDPKSQFRHYQLAEWRGPDLIVLDPLAAKPIQASTPSVLEAYRKLISGNVLVPEAGVPRSWAWRRMLRTTAVALIPAVCMAWFLWHRRERARNKTTATT